MYSTINPINLPPLNKVLAGDLAIPAYIVVHVVREAPEDVDVHANGMQLTIPKGAAHIHNSHIWYGNREYQDCPSRPRQTYTRLDEVPLCVENHISAKLRRFWKDRGHDVKVYRAVKCAPSVVVGQIPTGVTGKLATHEATFDLATNDWLLASPFDPDVMWIVRDAAMPAQYDRIDHNGTVVIKFTQP